MGKSWTEPMWKSGCYATFVYLGQAEVLPLHSWEDPILRTYYGGFGGGERVEKGEKGGRPEEDSPRGAPWYWSRVKNSTSGGLS